MELFIKQDGPDGTEYVPFRLTVDQVESGEAALQNFKDVTKHINNGFLGFLAEIRVLLQNEAGEIEIDIAGFNKRSFIDGLMLNAHYLPEEVTTDFMYRGVLAALNGFKKMMDKGRPLPLDAVRGLQYLAPLLPYYEHYSRQDPELSALLDQLIPKLKACFEPLFNPQNR